MKIFAISTGNFAQKAEQNKKKFNSSPLKASPQPCFKGSLLDKGLFTYHKVQILGIDPFKIEQYFEKEGIPALFQEGDNFARRMIAYCCYHASEIFKQLGYKRPNFIASMDFRKFGERTALGVCNYRPMFIPEHKISLPIRTTLFNTFDEGMLIDLEGKAIPLKWDNIYEIGKHDKKVGHSASGHFLSTFIHEFAHNLHYHALYTKYGAPDPNQGYIYNPGVMNILNNLNIPINKNPFVSVDIKKYIYQDVSGYGATALPETFAEAFTKSVMENLDLYKLRLTRNPFPMNLKNKVLTNVLHEIYEGKVGDGQGFI